MSLPDRLQNIASKNLNVTNGTIEDLSLDEKFDVITIVDVIEHVTDPKSLIQEAVKHLKEKGILCVVTPRVDSFQEDFLGSIGGTIASPMSAILQKNLTELLTNSGTKFVHNFSPSWFFLLKT